MNEVKVNLDDYYHNKARNLVEQMARDGIIAKGKDVITPIFLMLKESFCPIETQKEK